jgi:ABC-2 type transport system ATP-binding protein
MIQLEHVTKVYNGKVKAVDDISLEIADGLIVGFIGPNGAGKTTTLKMMTGILEPDAGTIRINGIDISKEPLKAKRQFGFVPDDPDMFLRLKGIEYLNFLGDIYGVPSAERKARIEEYAKTFEIDKALGDPILSYSHGMRQKIVLLGVLLHSPSVWILDEPLTGLDPQSAFALKEMLKAHAASGKTVFFSTHVLEVAEKLCDRVAIIHHGRILFYGTLEELQSKFSKDMGLEEIFLEMTNHG